MDEKESLNGNGSNRSWLPPFREETLTRNHSFVNTLFKNNKLTLE
jgi:hypothetical protein